MWWHENCYVIVPISTLSPCQWARKFLLIILSKSRFDKGFHKSVSSTNLTL